jgi:Rieske Fe-S protein
MQPHPSRRQLLVLGSTGLCLAATARLGFTADPDKPFDAGPLADFGEGIADTFAENDPHVFITRQGDRLWASTSLCTHKRCVVKRTGAGFGCKCHGSKFTPDGVPIKGPAKNPLPRYGVSIDDRKHVMVDLSKKFEQDEWEKDGAFVRV